MKRRVKSVSTNPFFSLIATPVLVTVFAVSASAQGVFDMGALTGTLSIDHVTQSENARASGISSADISRITAQQLSGSIKSRFGPKDTGFQPSQKNREANLAQIVRQTAANDPDGAAKMQRLFADVDVIAEIGKGIAPYGLRTNNVADAYAVYWMTAWQAANQDNSDFKQGQVAAVRQQSADILMNTQAFIDSDDRLKQELADIYLVQAALIQAVADEAEQNSTLRSQLAKAVKQGAAASGLELDTMTLTEDGFVPGKPRKGANASGAAGDDTKQASATGSDKTLQYGIMAALGLGAAFMIGKGMKRG
jgi:hypothetical protein